MTRRPFTLIFPYYLNPEQLHRQYKRLARMPEDIRSHLALIVIDDGSPRSPARPPKTPLGLRDFQLYRVGVDVRWNWLTCRNIGVHHALTDWVLLTDIDHELPDETARRIIERKLDATNVYRFSRVDAPKLTPYKIHPNTWLMTRTMFDAIGGYDERFSGFYGTDGEFRDRVRATAGRLDDDLPPQAAGRSRWRHRGARQDCIRGRPSASSFLPISPGRMTVAVCLLTCDRPELTEPTARSFVAWNGVRSDLRLLHADGGSTGFANLNIAKRHGFRTIAAAGERIGQMETLRIFAREAFNLGADWMLWLENDWESVAEIPTGSFLDRAARIGAAAAR
jgi:hypothetical protein